jgi:two-component sensor histidine kinase
VPNERITSTGTSLLEGLVGHEMNGKITLDFNKNGLHCVIEVPLNELQ